MLFLELQNYQKIGGVTIRLKSQRRKNFLAKRLRLQKNTREKSFNIASFQLYHLKKRPNSSPMWMVLLSNGKIESAFHTLGGREKLSKSYSQMLRVALEIFRIIIK